MYIKLVRFRTILIIFLFFLAFLLSFPNTFAQETIQKDVVYDTLFRTILFHRSGWELSMPILIEGEDEQLVLDFDYLGESRNDLSFSVIKCTYDWQINDIAEHRYIEGFNDVPIYDVKPSLNTLTDYIHFHTLVPGEDITLLSSGNYILRVHPYGMPDEILFTKRFSIAEKLTEINGGVKKINDTQQELQMEINLGDLYITNPLAEIKVVVIKNYNWNDQIYYKSPPILRGNTLSLDMPFQLVSNAGNEFRNFDIKSIKYISEHINYIDYQVPYYHIFLKQDEANPFEPYFSSDDINGRYVVEMTDAHDNHTESDYLYVHFSLKSEIPLASDVYIFGAITDWQLNEKNSMQYNYNKKAYQKTLRLKQGFYDYMYVTDSEKKNYIEYDLTEGNYSETENDYLVFVYYRENMSDFDRLIGYKLINSAKNSR